MRGRKNVVNLRKECGRDIILFIIFERKELVAFKILILFI